MRQDGPNVAWSHREQGEGNQGRRTPRTEMRPQGCVGVNA